MISNKIKEFMSKTRNQMLMSSIIVITIVLIIAQVSTFFWLSKLLRENSQRFTTTIIEQLEGRLNTLLEDIDSRTLELSLNQQVQTVLYKDKIGEDISLDERLKTRDVFINVKTFSHMIKSINLYSLNQQIYPLGNIKLSERLNPEWIKKADEKGGKIVWIGLDPNYPQDLLAIRQVKLVNDKFKEGGYLLIRIVKEVLLFIKKDIAKMDGYLIYLVDNQGHVISTNNDSSIFSKYWLENDIVYINKDRYISVKKRIDKTNGTLIILTPYKKIIEGITNLKNILIFVAVLGSILFIILSIFLASLITSPVRKIMSAMRHDDKGLLKLNPEQYFNYEINELNNIYNDMVKKNNYLVEMVYEKELSKSKAEMKAIQAQINPHFLFNTLEAFYWTLVERKENELSNLILSLSNLFRYTIKSDRDDGLIQIEYEINHIKGYLEIMKFRLVDRLEWDISYDRTISDVIIPKLTIQPLVENAIKHGIESKIGKGSINIQINSFDNDFIEILVRDNGKGISSEKLTEIRNCINEKQIVQSSDIGIGLNNVYRRLRSNFGKKVEFDIYSKEDQGTTIRLIIPIRRIQDV